ncbi:MAG: MBL fold metallo-hydrolase [Pseudomonadota bacterium]
MTIRKTKAAFAVALAAMTTSAAQAQRDFSAVEIETTEVADGIYMLTGAGGNMGLLVGDDGAILIDDQFAPLTEKIAAAIADVTDRPVKFLFNTHHHFDHTGGNENFGNAGALIIAHDNVRKWLSGGSVSDFGETPPAPEVAWPAVTFSDTVTFHMNGQDIHVFHPENAHTDGDAIVFFKTANVIHMGDVYFAGAFPYIDVNGGGSVTGAIAALEGAAAMIDDDTVVIPGHNELATKSDMVETIAMLRDVSARVQALIDDGLDEEAAIAADPLADLSDKWGAGFIDSAQMTRIAYRSLSAS